MNRKIMPALPASDEFNFDVYSFETLLAIGLPLVVLPDGLNGQEHYVINLLHVREYKVDSKGLIRFRYQADLENKWVVLTEEQSAALAGKIQDLNETVLNKLKTGGH